MKKILSCSLILFVFCLTSLLGGVFIFNSQIAYADVAAKTWEISTAKDLKEIMQRYGQGISANYCQPTDNIVLKADINMADLYDENDPTADVIYGTFGTEAKPFAGTFDGRGFKISNLKIDVASSDENVVTNQYAGLFGVTNGATIKNINIAGNAEFTTGGAINAYVGAVVGKMQNTTLSFAQITANITHNTDYDCNVNFGSLAGMANDSNIKNVICRSTNFGENWNFSRNDNKVSTFGGIVGKVSNSKILLAVASVRFNATITPNFIGDISIGGVVGNVSQGGSSIINVACENTFDIINNSVGSIVYVGEVVGSVTNPAPESQNISYIHYQDNVGVDIFGDQGDYHYTNESVFDFITPANEKMNSTSYFTTQKWHGLEEDWNFDEVWYFASSTIYLQSFSGQFEIGISKNLDTQILSAVTVPEASYQYGQSTQLVFKFNDIVENEEVVGNMTEFYNLSAIQLNNTEVAQIITSVIENKVTYRLNGLKANLYELAQNDNGEIVLTIKSVTKATAGDYSLATTTKKFSATVTSKLYDMDGEEEVLIDDILPGYVYFAESSNTTLTGFEINRMEYGFSYRIETRGKPNTPYAFVGWFMKKTDGTEVQLDINPAIPTRIFEIKFGSGHFKADSSNCEIYAKYRDNACVLTFKLDEGVGKVRLYSNDNMLVTESGQSISVSKDESSLKLEIYINKDYKFDVEQFIVELDVYKGDDPNKTFCSLRETYLQDEYQYYHFVLDMSSLNKENFEDTLSINIRTSKDTAKDLNWLWYTLGGVGGAIVLGLIIFLIVYFSRRKKMGGGSGGGNFSKKNYKNMYY